MPAPQKEEEENTSLDGYGGMSPTLYNAIVDFKKTGIYPSFCDLKTNRNAYFHWRNRCAVFTLAENGTLMYIGNGSSGLSRPVARSGETRLAIRFIHERIAHAGQRITTNVISRRVYWRSIRKDVVKYINECDFCRKKRDIRKAQTPLFHEIERGTSSEDVEMTAVCERLMLNSDIRAEHGEFYERSDDDVYEFVDEDGYGAMLEIDESILEEDANSAAQASRFHGSLANIQRLSPTADDPLAGSSKDMKERRVEEESEVPEAVATTEIEVDECGEIGDQNSELILSPSGTGASASEPSGRRQKRRAPRIDNGRPLGRPRVTESQGSKRLMSIEEENEDMRDRLRAYEAAASSGAMFMPAATPEIVQLQKNVLHLQEEVLLLKRQYLRAKISGITYFATPYDTVEDSPASESRADIP